MIERLIQLLTENMPATSLSFIALFIHLATNLIGGYGYFRDEFYYIACSENLAWGFVDHPPLSIIILWLNRMLLGDSLFALRLLPALAVAALVYLTGQIVRELGGGKTAQLISCIAVIIAPVYLIIGDFYSMNAFEPLFWMINAYILIKILNTGNQRLWLLFGIFAGFGLLNKHSMFFFGFSLILGLLLTTQRKQLISKWFWFGALIAFVIFLPNLLWQATHEWATLEFMQNAQQWKNVPMSPLEFISAQALFQHPVALPLWLTGILAFLFHNELKRYRFFVLTFVALFILFIVQRGKPYYLSPIYPLFLSGGAIAFEQFISRVKRKWLSHGYVILLIVGGLVTLPASLPILPVETYIRYASALGLHQPKMERHGDTMLPQIFADRFGWKEMVNEAAKAYNSLTEEEKAVSAIYTQNYGEAGAIDFYGGQYGLPKAISGHNSYWHWGLPGFSCEVLIIVGGRAEDHSKVFESVELFATHKNSFAMPFENNLPIFVCRKPISPLKYLWYSVKHFI